MQTPDFSRTASLIGADALERLKTRRVVLFGLGGVGSYVLEALARAGVGRFVLVDGDEVAPSNVNRQLIADATTVGRPKVEAARERVLRINPFAQIDCMRLFYLPGSPSGFLADADYVVDAVDTVTAKVYLAQVCRELDVPLISAMGTGNKTDPTAFRVADISHTQVCPLCRAMRKALREKGIDHLQVVYSEEPPLSPAGGPLKDGRPLPGSLPFVPAAAGLLIAKTVFFALIGENIT